MDKRVERWTMVEGKREDTRARAVKSEKHFKTEEKKIYMYIDVELTLN